ncbi:MAG: peptide chain release factor N(5)-glutamine methyltransferase [Treponema sp.]
MATIADARRTAIRIFSHAPALANQHNTAALDADVILQHLLNQSRAWLFAHADTDISSVQRAFDAAVEKRRTGLPIAYITGKKDFWGLEFAVTPDVLIPKADTELLVERCLTVLRQKAARGGQLTFLDPCTGSGCVAVAVLQTLYAEHITPVTCIAADISRAALAVAETNARQLLPAELQKCIQFYCSDMRTLENLQKQLPENVRRFDVIVANPPYIPTAAAEKLLEDGRSEPFHALDGGADGLDFIALLANNTGMLLKNGGVLLCEIGEYQSGKAAALLKNGGFSSICIHQDMALQDRLVEGIWHDTENR